VVEIERSARRQCSDDGVSAAPRPPTTETEEQRGQAKYRELHRAYGILLRPGVMAGLVTAPGRPSAGFLA
jgi:hypothetical protein